MTRRILELAITAAVGSLLSSNPAAAQTGPHAVPVKGPYTAKREIPPPAKVASQVRITKGPELELVRDGVAIIRWTSNNPGGTDDHYGVGTYSTDRKEPSHIAN